MNRTIVVTVLGIGWFAATAPLMGQTPVRALVAHENDIPTRLQGFGIVVGLDGTGDRAISSGGRGSSMSAMAVANYLRANGMPVSADELRPRNVAAVTVDAEISPYLRTGNRFDIYVSSLNDATSLGGGRLLIMPLNANPGEEPVATGAGAILITQDVASRLVGGGGSSGRIPDGGILEFPLAVPQATATPRLHLREPGFDRASRIAAAIDAVHGAGVATVEDPGTVLLNPPAGSADNVNVFLASIDTITVQTLTTPRIIIDRADGTVATVGVIIVGEGTVSHNGITVVIGPAGPAAGPPVNGMVSIQAGASIQDITAGLHAAGARPRELATIFDKLRQAGALLAEITIQ